MAQYSIDDVISILTNALRHDDAILVGGQALNFWATTYARKNQQSKLEDFLPFTSRDIDFMGDVEAAQLFADALQGRIYTPTIDDHTPEAAKVVLELDNQEKLEIDFLSTLSGLDESQVRRLAGKIIVPGSDYELLVMHPFHCLKGQLSNVYGPLKRRFRDDGEHQTTRIKLAVKVVGECLRYTFDRSEREGYELVEAIVELSLLTTAKSAFYLDQIDVLEAIQDHPNQSREFKQQRLPQILRQVTEKRTRYRLAMDKQEARRALSPDSE